MRGNPVKRKFATIAMLLLASFALIAAGCGSDDDGDADAPAAATTAAAEEGAASGAESSAADVSAGLQQMVTVAADTATKTATDAAAGQEAAEGLEAAWAPIEDTVKANDPDTYVEIEDSMEQLQSGDVAKAADGSTRLAAAVAAYLVKFPG